MCSPASFDTAYVQRASPTEPIVDTWPSLTLNAWVPNTSLVEKSTIRSRVPSVAAAASSTLYVPITFTRIVRTGLSRTVSTPAIPAQWTMCVAALPSSRTASASSTSAWWNEKFACSASSVPVRASRWRLSSATISFASTSRRASVVPMNPAPPVIRIRLPCRGTRRVYPAPVRALAALLTVSASLHITVWPTGPGGVHHAWTLRCSPTGGTLPHRSAACTKLARLRHPFAPVPPGVACTDIYGGPQPALVTGTFRGRRVHAAFNRHDGCEIARWDAVRFLFVAVP